VSRVEVEHVASKKSLKEFIRFPWQVYRGNPYWVPPLLVDVKDKLDRAKNPFFEHAERDLFLGRRDGQITGRIAAIIDHNHNSFHNEKIVFFGQYESLNDVDTAGTMLDTVAAWGRERGMDTLRGPVDLSLNDECAFLLEGFDSPPVVMMPYTPPYYLELMEACGLAKAKDMYAFLLTSRDEAAPKVSEMIERIRSSMTVTCRTAVKRRWEEEAEKIKFIYNRAWVKNWGFVPWTENEMKHMVKRLKQVADPDFVIIAEDKGDPVGFGFGLPDYNQILIKMNGRLFPFGFVRFLTGRKKIRGMRMLVFGVIKEYQQTGLSYLLAAEMKRQALAKGFEWAELSWQLEDNEAINRFALSLGGKIYKKYRIYEKKIA
jgi:hypothetical protein